MIVFAGVIGSGKTTYSQKLADSLGSEAFYESVDDNPILVKYYENPQRYAFALQIHFLNRRFRSIKDAFVHDNNVLDRSIYEDRIFTKVNTDSGNISEEEFAVYDSLLENMMEELEGMPKKAPDLLVYLDISLERELENIRRRGRPFEQIEHDPSLLDYYKTLRREYATWYESYDKSPKIRIDTDKYDVAEDADWAEVFSLIETKLREIREP